MKDIKPLLLILLSVGLISTWAYHIYDKTNYTRLAATPVKDTVSVNAVKDSLTQLYSNTIQVLDTRLDSSRITADSLQSHLDQRLDEINRLKLEISSILGKKDFSNKDLLLARQKIKELQDRVEQLNEQNLSMEEERQQLSATLVSLTRNVDSLQLNIRKLNVENESLNEKVSLATIFVASDVKIEAVETGGGTEANTSSARKTDKFVASFIVQNRVNQFTNTEVVTVLIQPDGHVLQNTVWDSGSFDSKADGKKEFTRKIRFDYERGEQKYLLFTVDADNCQKGTYTFQVWHNGVMIGQATKKLS